MSSTSTSRTSVASSILQELTAYWRRFAASGIGFARKYRYDPFFRTELNILLVQALFTVLILGFVAEGVSLLYRELSSQLVAGISESIVSGRPNSGAEVLARIEQVKTNALLMLSAAITVITVLASFVIARLALAPARNALSSQKQFIGNIAHELRTPLSIIKTNTEVHLLDSDVTPEARTLHKDTLEELDRISDIINNLLTLNVLVRPEKIPFANADLGTVVERMLGHLAPLIERKRLKVSLAMGNYRTVWGNATALEQIVMNVVRNAANYTPRGGTVRLAIAPDYRGHVVFTVQDSGIGIAEAELERIFEPFYRADQSRTRGTGGSGLGLAIVSELVKLHHGIIGIQSTKGEGTTVAITLPCGKTANKPAMHRPEIEPDYASRF